MGIVAVKFHRLSYQILVIFVLVVVVCLGVSGWLLVQTSQNIVTQKISEGDQNFAHRIAQNVAAKMESVEPTLTVLAQTLGVRLMEATEVQGEIDSVQRRFTEITSIYVADVEGQQIARTGTGKLENVSNISSFQVARGGDAFVSDVYVKPLTSEPMQTITLPIMDNGRVVGVLSSEISFSRIMVSVMDIYVGRNANVVVVAVNGLVVAHTRANEALGLDLSKSPVVAAVLNGEEGVMEDYTDELGHQVLGSYSPVRELGWGVIIQRPLADIDAEIGQLRMIISGVMTFGIFLSVLAGMLLSRQIAKPIRQLATASERVAQGDMSTAVDVKSSNEVGTLARSFNQMVVSLKKSLGELERRTESLRQSEEKYRNLAEGLKEVIYRADPETFVATYVNNAIESLYGYTIEEWLGDPSLWENTIHPDDKERVLKEFTEAQMETANVTVEYRIITKNKIVKWVEGHLSWQTDQQGKVVSMNGLMYDITERKNVEKERERLIGDLEATIKELQAFAYTISHDLQGPLVTIESFARALRSDLEERNTERVEEDIASIEIGISRMQRLLKGILEYARVGRVVEPTENVPFKEIIKESLEQLAGQIRSSKASISLAETFPTVYTDRMRMVQVLNNLIQNSTEYRDKKRPLTIEIGHRSSAGEVVFFVRDNGMGIKADKLEKVFELFYRGVKDSKGTGAGLAIARRVIEAHGGRMWAESEVGKGTTMYFTLPGRKDTVESESSSPAQEAAH